MNARTVLRSFGLAVADEHVTCSSTTSGAGSMTECMADGRIGRVDFAVTLESMSSHDPAMPQGVRLTFMPNRIEG
ncbi:hypothetical protein [Cellulomonas sp. SG140]|uniref:hypothetical protein n=1 Tax=Cellulomonas sp. SG140 TaxID=2976536 RepID=UPI0021E87AE3|nr:hypothetical protein [Cellulomonas sp. SG140]